MDILFIYGGFESFGIEILSNYVKQNGIKTDLFFFSRLFSDSILEIDFLNDIFFNREIKELKNKISITRPLLICFSVVSNDYLWSCKVAEIIKKDFPEIKIIFGGIHPTLVPKEVMKNNYIDFVCEGDGEECLLELFKTLKENRSNFSKVPNLFYRDKDRVKRSYNNSSFYKKNINSTPDKTIFYQYAPYFKKDLTFQFTRGCIYNCSFCFHSYIHRKDGYNFKKLSPEEAIDELLSLKLKYNPKNIIFDDDLFVFNIEWIDTFLKLYKKHIDIPFMAVIHIDFISKELLCKLQRAGCTKLEIAVQTLNTKVREKILFRKEKNIEIEKALNIVNESKIPFNIQHMLGIPQTSIEDEEKATRFYSNYNVKRIYTFFLTYYPCIDITEWGFKNKIISKEKYNNIKKGIVSSYEINGDIPKKILPEYNAIRILFSLIPIMPEWFIKFYSRKKRYLIFSSFSFFFRGIDTLNILKNNDLTAKIYIKRYIYHILKFLKINLIR